MGLLESGDGRMIPQQCCVEVIGTIIKTTSGTPPIITIAIETAGAADPERKGQVSLESRLSLSLECIGEQVGNTGLSRFP